MYGDDCQSTAEMKEISEVLGSGRHVSLLEKLKREKGQLETRLENANNAIKSLEDNPKFEEILNTLAKANLPF